MATPPALVDTTTTVAGTNDTRVICIIDQQTASGAGSLGQGSAVLRGVVKKGGVKIEIDLAGTVFSYAPRPASAMIATQGLFFP